MGEQNAAIRFDSCRSFYHPPRVSKQSKFDTLKQFYVLKAWRGYFVKRTQHGVMTIRTDDPTVRRHALCGSAHIGRNYFSDFL